MSGLHHVRVQALDPRRFESVLPRTEYDELRQLIETARGELRGRVVWNVNSTAKGGGVVELLRPLVGYCRGAGVDARWVVISGDRPFFEVTKRLHNRLHGFKGDGGPLGPPERGTYERTLAANASGLAELLHPRDVVILHDPQTAGLIDAVRRVGATVIWRCHIGRDHVNAAAHAGWAFLEPYVRRADAYVFSRAAFAWEGLPEEKVAVIPPSIDAFSPKNADQSIEQSLAILSAAGICSQRGRAEATFTRWDGTPGRVDRQASVIQEQGLGPDDPLVVQVSRWDRLKDPRGVMRGFAEYIAPRSDAHLLLVGPSTESVADDPEGAQTFASVRGARARLPAALRRRVHLASLPMEDEDENAAMVNAVQRRADVVVQKSLAEGFGLTVAEAMWKSRPVLGSRVGGIEDQIVDGVSGILLSRPHDLAAFGTGVVELLTDPSRSQRIGAAAHERVRQQYLAPRHLGSYFDLIQGIAP